MNKKYEFTGETKTEVLFGKTVVFHRIKALISFGTVNAGEIGGWIESENNLDESGNAWVSGNARVRGNARVDGNAWVYGDAQVRGNAWVSGNAQVHGNAWVRGDARVYGDAQVCGNARVTFWYKEAFKLTSTVNFVFKNSWSSYRDFFFNKVTGMWSVGCFLGTSAELIEKAYKDSEWSGKMYERYVKFAENMLEEEGTHE